jgi:hypothetical protein
MLWLLRNPMNVNLQADTAGAAAAAGRVPTPSGGEPSSGAIGQLKEKAWGIAQRQKQTGADQVGTLARAVHGAAEELGREFPRLARYVDDAAERLDRASCALRERAVEDLAHGLGDFARRQPATVFAAAVFAGLALSRFLKNAPRSAGLEHDPEKWTPVFGKDHAPTIRT